MPENAHESKGLFESLSMLAATLIAIVQTRLELLSVDLEEERAHLLSILVLILTAMFFIGVGLVLAVILLVTAFWETHRLLVLGTLSGVFLLAGIAAVVYILHKISTKPRLFTASITELDKDRQQLGSHS